MLLDEVVNARMTFPSDRRPFQDNNNNYDDDDNDNGHEHDGDDDKTMV